MSLKGYNARINLWKPQLKMGITKLSHHIFASLSMDLWEMKRNIVLRGFHRMPHYTRLTHSIMETVSYCENTKTKSRIFSPT